jgi:valyl-tRNA synthetase
MGLNTEDARKRVLAALQAEELLRGETAIEHAVGHCYKCGSVIQPLVKDQWFLKMQPLAEAAARAIEGGEVRFYPEARGKQLLNYLAGIRDWNLSRQIPWGIPIPAFQNVTDPDDWIYDERVDEPSITVDSKEYRREEDTFDTWFTSGQWPFITTDYLAGGELARFYPNAVMETGHDILYPWVSRMLMLGLKVTGKVPFKDVYLHGLVLDEHGQKMSKSKGNVINPMETLGEYGSDALRLGLVAARSAGQNQAFSTTKVVAGRNFCNKLWNIARFIEDKLGEEHRLGPPAPVSLADHWIMRELLGAAAQVESLLADYRFAEASELVYHTIWSSLADWYIEASKQQDNPSMLAWTLDTALKLAHPFAPFVTETIWQTLPWYEKGSMLISAPWPAAEEYNDIAAGEFERVQQLVTEIRFVTNELPGSKKYAVSYHSDSLVADNAELIAKLARLEKVEQTDQPRGLRLANSGREAWLVIDESTLYEHQSNLEVRLAEAKARLTNLAARLSNERYVLKAPAELVEASRQEATETKALIERLANELTIIKN